ncbi:MAG: AAA family ATPase [Chloroflexota bacterium]
MCAEELTSDQEKQIRHVQDDKGVKVGSLQELLDIVSGRRFEMVSPASDAGLAERLPFPFLGLVGQQEMKLALLLALINPALGGVLLIGPRGTGKSTAVRSLVHLLPEVPRSLCFYGCMPEDIETGGLDAVCPDCAQKYGQGEPLAALDTVRLVELPLNATLVDVIGGIADQESGHQRLRLHRGLLAQADKNLLYVDEVNLLADNIVDAILDAAAQGCYTVRRGPISATYRSRFVFIGSMNPEEGYLRPQILERFGLRVIVCGLDDSEERLEAYRRVHAYLLNPRGTIAQFEEQTALARKEIQLARDLLPQVKLPEDIARRGLTLIGELGIDSLRAEITLFEAARAYAAADARQTVERDDIHKVFPMAMRLRHSSFMQEFITNQQIEEEKIKQLLHHHENPAKSGG